MPGEATVNRPTHYGTPSGPSAALDGVIPAIEQLERALGEERMGQAAILHALVGDERLQRLEKLAHEQRHEFDAFDFIGQLRLRSGASLWASEEFHSDLLAWLLRPTASHGLGDSFLRQLLRRAGMPETLQSVDWSAVQVIREWEHVVHGKQGYLDILILDESSQILCAIENKTFSTEHHEQLTRYRNALKIDYRTFTRYHVFLTPWGTEPFRDKEKGYWHPLTYATIRDIVQQIVDSNDQSPNADVRAFLRQYATTLRRNLVPDTSVSQLARQIYLEHREAIEIIIANRPSRSDELKPLLKEAIKRQPGWMLELESDTFVGFRSADWDQHEATRTGTGWAPDSNTLLLFEFTIPTSGRPWLKLTLARGNGSSDRLREMLFEAIKENPTPFRLKPTSLSEDWTLLHEEKDYILSESDFGAGWNEDRTRTKLREWVEKFASTAFPAMNDVILRCLREYEDDQRISEAD